MKPAPVDLPTIWRGCDWGPITLKWKDGQGNPLDVSGFTPQADSLNIDLHASFVTDGTDGATKLLLGRDQTINLKLGIEKWDWIWKRQSGNPPVVTYRYPPLLAGRVEIKDPTSTVGGDTPPGGTANGNPPILPPST